MRWFFYAMALAITFICGCASRKVADKNSGDEAAGKQSASTRKSVPAAKTKSATSKPEPQKPETPKVGEVAPLDVLTGRVVSANDSLRFVVLDFLPGRLPPLERRLGIYRQGQKVGEVRITGPSRENTIAADLITGEAKAGDQARSD